MQSCIVFSNTYVTQRNMCDAHQLRGEIPSVLNDNNLRYKAAAASALVCAVWRAAQQWPPVADTILK